MVQTWKEAVGDDVKCPKCGAVYAVRIRRLPARDRDEFDCSVCGHRLRSANSTESWSFQLKENGLGDEGKS